MDGFLTLFDTIGLLARRRYQTAERAFAALGLNHTEARLLTLLEDAGGAATQDHLSGALFVDRSNAGRALKRLEREGYVVRRRDETDRRTNRVHLADKGRDAVTRIADLKVEIARSFFVGLTEAEAGALAERLKRALA
ncbi:MAG: hypothetical protein Kilf2KO_17060 [Rhodospirillales bacterium]